MKCFKNQIQEDISEKLVACSTCRTCWKLFIIYKICIINTDIFIHEYYKLTFIPFGNIHFYYYGKSIKSSNEKKKLKYQNK